MSAYDEKARADLRGLFIANGVEPARAAMIADLACFAAEKSVETVFEVVGRAEDYGAKLMALEMALQLAAFRMTEIFNRTHALGDALGAPQIGGAIQVSS